MRGRTVAQLALGFGQGNVETFLTGLRTFHQELQRNGGFACPGRALHQKHVSTRKPARQDVVQPPNPGFRLAGDRLNQVRKSP